MVHKKKQGCVRQLLCWVAGWLLLLGMMPQVYAEKGDLELPVYNIAILIDKSGSMNGTDRNHLAQEAAKMFVDSLYEEDNDLTASSSQIGVIAFADTAETISGMREVDFGSIAEIKELIGSIEYYPSGTHGTSLGLAVKSATEMLAAKDDSARKNLIVLFTDGYTEAVDLAQSAEDLATGLESAQNLESEIFIVGLNNEGKITEDGKKEIWNIANSTQRGGGLLLPDEKDEISGKVNYLITDSMDEIRGFYIDLFAYLMEAPEAESVEPENGVPETIRRARKNHPDGETEENEDKWNYYKINVTTSSVAMIKVYILSNDPIGEIALWNPDGERADAAGRVQDGIGYKLLTITQPDLGPWYVGTLKDVRVQYDVRYIFITGIRFSIDLEKTGTTSGRVAVTASYSGQPFTDLFQEQTVTALCTVTPESDEKPFRFELNSDPDAGTLDGAFDVPKPGRYWVEVLLEADQLERTLEGFLDFDVEASLDAVILRKGKTVTLDLNEVLRQDWENLTVDISGVDVPADTPVAASGAGSVLEIRGLQFGEAELMIHAVTSSGTELEIPCTVRVQRNPLLFIVLGLLLLLLIVAVGCWFKRRNQRIPGVFRVSCETVDRPGSPRNLVAEDSKGIRGQSFTMYALIQSALDPAAGDPSIRQMQEVLEEYRRDLEGEEYRVFLFRKPSGGFTYRYGPSKRFLSGEVFQNEVLTVRVTFEPEASQDEELNEF